MSDSIFFKRESKRSYLDKPVPEDALDRIYEKIRWSPSCSNNQPWRFIFVSDKEQRGEVVAALARGNQWMAKAPVIAVICGKAKDDYSREDNEIKYYQFDAGLATMSFLLAATEEGLMTHPTAGWSAPAIKEALSIPEEYDVMCVVSLGYQGPIDHLDERAREADEAPRTRKELKEIIAADRFDF